jgi:hypothetical protein
MALGVFARALAAAGLAAGLILPGAAVGADSTAVPVTVVGENGRFSLLRDGQPYKVRGANIDRGDVAALAAHGGNSLRTYASRDGQRVLDEAGRHGLTVAMGLEIGRERLGFDYDDEAAVARQLEYVRGEVLKYKDHPALLLWIIGNEPDLKHTNPKVFDAINDISKMIHEVDGKHPTATALSGLGPELAAVIRERAPDLDIIGLQKYADIVNVPRYIRKADLDRPFLITEWGPLGHWEVDKTSWGAPIEPDSSQKAAQYLRHYEEVIASHPEVIVGSYVFLWGRKQERTPTWYSMFLADGSATETVDVMHRAWRGAWPDNRAPRIEALLLNGKTSRQDVVLEAGMGYDARVVADDPDDDALGYRWVVRRESEARQIGGDKEQVPEELSGLIEGADGGHARLAAPVETGAYRLFVYVQDGEGHAAHANVPFLVR